MTRGLDVETARLTEISNHLVTAQAAMYDAENPAAADERCVGEKTAPTPRSTC